MNKRLSFLTILLLLLSAFIFAACDSGTPATPTVTQDDTPGINITRSDYNSALAKWQVLNVQEYNISEDYSAFSTLAGSWELHVTKDAIEPTSFSRSGTPTTPTPGQDLYLLTVDGIFNNIDRVLTDTAQSEQTYAFQYKVQFDPDKGYPTHFSARSVPNPTTGSGVIADADYTIDVKSLSIIK